ncbi:MAG: glycosyltransferase [Thermomonas haemolytica]
MADNAPPPRILHITRNLPPLVGGMERLNWHIADELSRQAQVQVIGPRGAAALKPANVELSEVPLRPLPRFLLTSAWRALRLARRQHPQLVLAGSGLTAPAAWLAARGSGARAGV